MRLFVAMLLMIAANATLARGPVYVGEGRYTCSDNTVECAVIQQNNRILSQQK